MSQLRIAKLLVDALNLEGIGPEASVERVEVMCSPETEVQVNRRQVVVSQVIYVDGVPMGETIGRMLARRRAMILYRRLLKLTRQSVRPGFQARVRMEEEVMPLDHPGKPRFLGDSRRFTVTLTVNFGFDEPFPVLPADRNYQAVVISRRATLLKKSSIDVDSIQSQPPYSRVS